MPTSNDEPAFVKRSPLVSGEEYAQLLNDLKTRFRKSQIKAAVKVNSELLEYYWAMGRDISRLHADAKWGSAFFDCLSLDLKAEFPGQSGFSAANIRYAFRWYKFYNQGDIILHQLGEEFHHQVGDELDMPSDFGMVPWKHHVLIFTKSKSIEEAIFYIEKTIENGWSRAQLEDKIDENLFGNRGNAITNFDAHFPAPYSGLAKSILKSPYDFSFAYKKFEDEKQLEDILTENITRFLLELGEGFAFVGRQKELKMPGGQIFKPDMIFYHTKLKCYICLELKVVEYIPEFAGKLNFYVSAVDELLKEDDDNPTIGLLICKSKDDTVVEWSLRGVNRPLGVAEYTLHKISKYLPSEQDIKNILDTYSANADK